MFFIEFLFAIIGLYVVLSAGYLLLFSLLALTTQNASENVQETLHTFAILIPAFKEDVVIRDTVASALNHNYPKELFAVYVIADSLQPSTIEHLRGIGATVIEVEFESSTKAKSLNAALNSIPNSAYSHAIVLDVDNIMCENFMHEINTSINKGYDVVQGHRTAKNTNTSTAILDAISEEVNNSIFRKGQRALGLSAMIIGSGFAIEWNLYKRIMSELHDVAGEDRELDIRLIEEKKRIEYNPNAVVLDEKVASWDVYTRQRTRWSAAHVHFLKTYFFKGFRQLLTKGNVDYFNRIVINLILPRVLFVGVVTFLCALSLLFEWFPLRQVFITSFVFMAVALGLAIPKKLYSRSMLKALLQLPQMFFAMAYSFTKIKGQSTKFLHTPHSDDSAK